MNAASPKVMVRASLGLLNLLVVLGVVLFGGAGTLRYPQAWTFLSVFGGSSLAITIYLVKRDPALLERRTRAGPTAEREGRQKLIQLVASLAFIGVILVPALDRRCGWSRAPLAVVAAGELAVAVGFFVVFLVFRENTYASAVIEATAEQRVVATGPYAWVRHPMYAGAFVMLVGVPLALGSYWGLCAVVPLMASIVWRLLDEEAYLSKHLVGYDDYRKKIRYRLIPGVW
ncbi:MAG TPA: isoprenylcysteine carboxylmethyltransferase family protein [Polyangiaceae bacterium]|nr:isoprenylcysteine carboxylmethyltransferase family protein [Polyangiaceae bacterium]